MKHLKHNKSSVTNINYHLVFCSKYRRSVLTGEIAEKLKEVFSEIAESCGCKIKTQEIMPDHVHLFIEGTPLIPIHLIVRELKGKSSHIMRNSFPILVSRLPNLWTRSYYCETIGSVSNTAIQKYIENQKNK